MSIVIRKYRCGLGHEWDKLVDKAAPPPEECPICQEIVKATNPTIYGDPEARSDNIGAPLIQSERAKAIKRFEYHAFKKPHFDDGKPLMTNLRDNVRPGETYAVPETPSTNDTMRMTRDMIEQQRTTPPQPETPNGRQMATMGGGWQGVSQDILAQTAGAGTTLPAKLPVVDLNSKRARPA